MHFANTLYELLNFPPGKGERGKIIVRFAFVYNGPLSRQIRVSCPDDVGVVSLGYA